MFLVVVLWAFPLYAQRDTLGTLSNALTDAAPSVLVQSRGGSPGAGSVVSLRGAVEPATSSQPLLIIDGVRVDNGAGHDNAVGAGTPAPARFDDLDPSEIEHIEILPGAAAASLYGPGAADGVILVTTRSGSSHHLVSGRVSVEGGLTNTPSFEQPNYEAWGHTPTGPPAACYTYQRATGTCVVDSVTHYNPLLFDATTPFTTANERRFGAELSAGAAGQRAFLAAHYRDELGTLVMPDPDIAAYETGRGVAPPITARRPSAADRADIRGQLTSDIGKSADITLGGGLVGVHQRGTDEDELLSSAAFGPARRDTNDGWSDAVQRPSQIFTDVPTERTIHAMGNVTGRWRPLSGVELHATAGSDATDQTSALAETNPFNGGTSAFQANDRQVSAQYTTDLGATVTLHGSTTTIGGQYLEQHFRESTDSSTCTTNVVTTTPPLLCGSSFRLVFPSADRTQSLYANEVVTVADRLTLGAGARWNHERLHILHLTFTSLDPSFHGQLVVIGTTATPLVALHGAFGETRSMPPARDAFDLVAALPQQTCGVGLGSCGPEVPAKVPAERQREAEGGVSASLPNDRLTFDVTAYERRSVQVVFPGYPPLYFPEVPYELPGGIVRDGGLDASLSGRIIESRVVNWNASFNAFINENKVLRMPSATADFGATTLLGVMPGHPVFGIYASPYSYADVNHDGVIEPSEVTIEPGVRYVGPAIPTRGASLSTAFELFGRRLRIGSLFDYRGGYVLPDVAGYEQALLQSTAAVNVPGASLADQARAIAGQQGFVGTGYVQRVDALRWRELSVTAPVPQASSVEITLAVRNLALSTNYKGPDPDADLTTGNALELRLPQTRTWLLRVTAGF
jgi:TonB-dependent SusC/RagA subfamily outer membrane receptor